MLGTFVSIVSVSIMAMQSFTWTSAAVAGLVQALVPALLMNVAIVGINQLYDVEIDKVNKPYLPLASGELSMQQGGLLSRAYGNFGRSLYHVAFQHAFQGAAVQVVQAWTAFTSLRTPGMDKVLNTIGMLVLLTCCNGWLPLISITFPTESQLSRASARSRSDLDTAPVRTHCARMKACRVLSSFAGFHLLLVHVCRCDHCSGLCHAVASVGCDERVTSPAGYTGRQPSAGGAVLDR
jgi:hypothetical protein